MLLNVLKRLTGVTRADKPDAAIQAQLLERAHELSRTGDDRAAIKAYRAFLETDPSNIEALNGLGACLAYIGDTAQAATVFELAYSMDDTYIPAMVNHAKMLADTNRGEESIAFLRRAKIVEPSFAHADSVYAGLCLRMGQAAKARAFQARSWFAGFDNLRLANCYLFWSTYDDLDESLLAAEHRFWAETMLPPDISGVVEDTADLSDPVEALAGGRRIRIGYWSPDFRSHSVRYFFRPLLDSHDRDKFEIFLFHDFPGSDGHTEAVREKADHFHDVSELSDADLYQFIRSHQLDILVEMAGHTSHNRMNLLAHRMAAVQLSALGYPPTSGLRSIDGKIMDRHCVGQDSRRHFSEQPILLPTSFWCFDPKEPIPIAGQPPMVSAGVVTFGCFGNIAKITPPLLDAWDRILSALPTARLLIRSISFEDPLATNTFGKYLRENGLPMDRVFLLPPEGGINFFRSYDEVDIVLDTFPFNGGTTTCFAAFMGVPVVSLSGKSLIGRMGASVMSNMGAADLVVESIDAYVDRAVALAADPQAVSRFKQEARARFQSTGLGNEHIFAREFEGACLEALARKGRAGPITWQPAIDALPPNEIVRRAYAVLRRGQSAAAARIIDHCLREYPDCGAAHVLRAQQMAWDGRQDEAAEYLQGRLASFGSADRISALLVLARQHLVAGDHDKALSALNEVSGPVEDPVDAAQERLLRAVCSPSRAAGPAAEIAPRSVLVLVPCNSVAQYELVRREFEDSVAVPAGWTLRWRRCSEGDRIDAYRAWEQSADDQTLLIVQKNVRICSDDFLHQLAVALKGADIVGFAGATRWSRVDWRLDEFQARAGCFLSPSSEGEGLVDVQVVGAATTLIAGGMAVLDGTVLALGRNIAPLDLDEALLGCATLLEEVCVRRAAAAGARVAVHHGLCVLVDPAVKLDTSNQAEARLHCADTLGLDPFAHTVDDYMAVSAPASSIENAVAAARTYFGWAA